MPMDFFRIKKYMRIVASVLSFCVTWGVLLYSVFLSQAETVYCGKSFYFVAVQTHSVAVGSWDAQLSGGAGYPLSINGETQVVLSVYLRVEDANMVVSSWNDGELSFIERKVECLYFQTPKEKKNKVLYIGALNSMYGGICALEQVLYALDRGLPQKECARILRQIESVFSHNARAYEKNFAACAKVCQRASKNLQNIAEGTIYGKDLRYALCDLTVNYLKLTSIFSL